MNFLLMIMTLIILMLALVVMVVSSLLSKKMITDREKTLPLSVDLTLKDQHRLPFSLRFFLIAVMFLIFDVEITLLLPLASIYNTSSIFSWMITGMFFLIILLAGLYHEWNQGALNWKE